MRTVLFGLGALLYALPAHAGGVSVGTDGPCRLDLDFDTYYAVYPFFNGDPSLCATDDDATTLQLDCDDTTAAVNPGAAEVCNGIDDDCDALVDESSNGGLVYRDTDADGYGSGIAIMACPSIGWSTNSTDCNNTNAAVHPNAVEVCNNIDDDCDGGVDEGLLQRFYIDQDNDGYGAGAGQLACTGVTLVSGDCDDGNDRIHPTATEICNLQDDDCDGSIDEGWAQVGWYPDDDGDGFGVSNGTAVLDCAQPTGFAADPSDCDDGDPAVNPAATEICNLRDDDCDGSTDEGVRATFYPDDDGDGFGENRNTVQTCVAPTGYAPVNGDCEPDDANSFPGAPEQCDSIDNDCDGSIDEGVTSATWYRDADGDGFGDPDDSTVGCSAPAGHVLDGSDCDDGDDDVNPGAVERCNGFDDDCDGLLDDFDDGLVGDTTFYSDLDTDGFGADPRSGCDAWPRESTAAGDCDDADADVYPGAFERCNGVDDDCDGSVDEGFSAGFRYFDGDGDGYGSGFGSIRCEGVLLSGDCDETDATRHPGATETCDGQDDDCDGAVDDGLVYQYYFPDADNDGYGNRSSSGTLSCKPISGKTTDGTDCADADFDIHPNAPEVCNAEDDDCDGLVDEGLTPIYWYPDADDDGFGDDYSVVVTCGPQPSNTASEAGDCNDTDAAVHPDADEIACNLVDEDCDGELDNGVADAFWYRDADGDGFGVNSGTLATCPPDASHVAFNGDCDDTRIAVNPAAVEVCDGLDNNCNGSSDEGATGGSALWVDSDRDGYGSALYDASYCGTAPEGTSFLPGDCADGDASVHPFASEVCDGHDQDCDAVVDEDLPVSTWYSDGDQDGYGEEVTGHDSCDRGTDEVRNGTDCDDTDPTVNPGAPEVCDGLDQDCDADVDDGVQATWFVDGDGDGYGSSDLAVFGCGGTGLAIDGTDCDDADSTVSPGATELCNGFDDDCDGSIDDGLELETWYYDGDGDGYGIEQQAVASCVAPVGYVEEVGDCDDVDALIHPDAVEICNLVDDDCDGAVDDDLAATAWYADVDGDGYGDPESRYEACGPISAYDVQVSGDCDDVDASVHPGQLDDCDLVDGDCDGQIDEDPSTTWYPDADGDGFGNGALDIGPSCDHADGTVPNGLDCNDADRAINPAAVEVCAGPIDENCDGEIGCGTDTGDSGDTGHTDVVDTNDTDADDTGETDLPDTDVVETETLPQWLTGGGGCACGGGGTQGLGGLIGGLLLFAGLRRTRR